MRRFLLRLLIVLPVPMIIFGVSFYVDPGNILRTGYESGIVDLLVKGDHVTGISTQNYNDRLLQRQFIERMRECPDVITLGSSKVMLLSQKEVGGRKFINNGVAGACLEDYLAIYELYEEKGCKIEKVILDVVPYLLNDNHGQVRWKELAVEFDRMYKKIYGHESGRVKTVDKETMQREVKELLSIPYFKESTKQLIYKGWVKKYYPTNSWVNNEFTKHADGSICYDAPFRKMSKAAKLKRVNSKAMIYYSLKDYSGLSARYQDMLERFVDYLQARNINVVFFLGPFHPKIYNEYLRKEKDLEIVFTAEQYYLEFAKRKNITVLGGYSPNDFGFNDDSFYDGVHCKEEAIHELLSRR